MSYLIGTDEAGYGPNLGPLTVCGTMWQVENANSDLYDDLSDIVVADSKESNKLRICDSKSIYSSTGSILQLETSVLAILYSCFGQIPSNILELANLIRPGIQFSQGQEFSWDSRKLKLPLIAEPNQIKSIGEEFSTVCQDRNVALTAIDCNFLFPCQFNRMVQDFGNKAEILSCKTLEIVRSMIALCDESTLIVCDKHGGRSKYLAMINQYLTDEFVSMVMESRKISAYRWSNNDGEVNIRFQTKAESFLPTALSSMIAKYFREVAMEVWNRFWETEIPGIRPTRGYPVDARRFKKDIATKQLALGIADESIWRSR